jgi:hypothetical protein
LGRITAKRNRACTFSGPDFLEKLFIQISGFQTLDEIPYWMPDDVYRADFADPSIIACKGMPIITYTGNDIVFIDAIDEDVFFHLSSCNLAGFRLKPPSSMELLFVSR